MQKLRCALRTDTIEAYSYNGIQLRRLSAYDADALIVEHKAEWVCKRCLRSSNRGRCLGSKSHAMVVKLYDPHKAPPAQRIAMTDGTYIPATLPSAELPGIVEERAKSSHWNELHDRHKLRVLYMSIGVLNVQRAAVRT